MCTFHFNTNFPKVQQFLFRGTEFKFKISRNIAICQKLLHTSKTPHIRLYRFMLSDLSRKIVSRVYTQTDKQTNRQTDRQTDKASVYILAALGRGEKSEPSKEHY